MPNPDEPAEVPEGFGGLPLQPTGSGVADLEIAYEQMRVAEGIEPAGDRAGDDGDGAAVVIGAGEAESEAHPS